MHLKKGIKIFLFFISFIAFNIYEINDVNGDYSINFGGLSSTNSFSYTGGGSQKINSLVIAVGIRVSLVYSKDGTRVEGTKSIDYWNDSDYGNKNKKVLMGYHALLAKSSNQGVAGSYGTFSEGTPRHFNIINSKKLTKQEYAKYYLEKEKKNKEREDKGLEKESIRQWWSYNDGKEDVYYSNYIIAHGKDYNKEYSKVFEGTPYLNDVFPSSTSYHQTTWLNGTHPYSGTQFAYYAVKAISSNISHNDWATFNKFLVNCGWVKNSIPMENVKLAGLSGVTVQFEPVEFLSESKEKSGLVTYLGSISEIIGMAVEGNLIDSWWCGLGSGTCNGGYQSLSQFNPGIFAKYIESGDPDKPAPRTIAGLNLSENGAYTKNEVNAKNQPIFFKNQSSPFGVSLINLSDFFGTQTCDTNAKNYISNYVNSKLSKEEARFNYFKEINEVSIDGDTGKPVYDNCIDTSNPTGYMYGSTPLYNVKKECNVLDPDNIDLFNGYANSVSGNVCVKYDCNTLANKIYSSYFNSNKSKYEGEISKLKKQYPGNNMLDTTYWQNASEFPEIFGKVNGPKCENIEIDCDVTQNVVGNCENNGISFTDSSKKFKGKECYKAGVSYNVGSVIQGSKAQELSSSTCNVYCKESVTFNLPGSPSGLTGKAVAAGTVLKWGVTSKSDSKFGEMTVTRTCQATGTNCNLNNPMNWTNKIGTKVSVYFKETNKAVTSRELQTNLSEVKFNGNLPTNTSANLSSTSCNSFNGCKNIMNNGGDFTLSAKFTFNYGNDAHNYSDKSTASGKIVTNVSADSKYIDIGYGFPTKFTNRAYIFNIYGSEHNKYLWGALDTMRGYLYASIKNIGTKVTGGYHFDKIIKDTSSSDDSYVVSGNEYSVRYSCPVSVNNPLMDTECFDKDGNKYPLGSSYCKDDEKPKGLDVVFRTVQLINKKEYETGNTSAIEAELNKAFPGRAGKGRYTSKDKNDNRIVGTNWLTIDSNEANNTKRIFDILSNMVYAQKPAYHIVLDTTKINYIRKNNVYYRSVDLDPYTNNQQYKFDKTNAPDYSYGASEFITDLINKNWLDGECTLGDSDSRAKRGACRQS